MRLRIIKIDNAETFLMNVARGAGLKGLGGIRPVNGNVIRPLLAVERGEVEKYLEEEGIAFCVDETNKSDAYMRNRIRNHILPYFEEQVNKRTVTHINETMERLREIEGLFGRGRLRFRGGSVLEPKKQELLSCRLNFNRFRM